MPRGRPRMYAGPLQPGKKSAAVPRAMVNVKTEKKKAEAKSVKNFRLSAPMRTLVDRRVNKHLETKELRYLLFTPTAGAGSTAYTLRNAISDLSIKPLLCPITQSDEPLGNSPYRLGNTIHPVSLTVRVKLYVSPADGATQGTGAADRGAIQPYLVVGHNKNVRDTVDLTANNYATTIDNFWRDTNGASTQEAPAEAGISDAFTGERSQYINGRLNTSIIRPIKGGVKQPILVRPVGFYQNPVVTEGGGGFATSHVERNYVFRVPIPKKLRYNNNNSEYPESYAPFLACGFTYVDGAAASEQAPLRMETNVTFRYKDA